ncbi:MAG: hypothetical protein ACI837_003280 [Crocinitomicaceae bacterium]|jgi:hypothetical protein
MKNALILIALFFTSQSFAQPLGDVIGNVYENGTKIAAIDAVVYIESGGSIYRTKADLDGRFKISAIPAGKYQMHIRYQGDTMPNIFIDVPMDGFHNCGDISFVGKNAEFDGKYQDLDGGTVTAISNEMKLVDGNLPVATLTAEEIDKSPAKFDLNGLITGMTSNVRQTADGSLVFRGARKGDMIYMIDGVKTREAGSVPGASIARMMVYTGGLPAKYGDTLGGVVVLESKSYFDLYRSWEGDQIRKGLR